MTARIHLLSPDLRRPGRVGDLIIPVLDPTGDDRKAFLEWMISPLLEERYKALGKTLKEKPASPEIPAPPSSPEQEKTLLEYQRFLDQLDAATIRYSAASFSSLRSELIARAKGQTLPPEKILAVIQDHIPPAIEETRRYQTLQALVNCTRRSLLPDPDITEDTRNKWGAEIRALEARGIH